MTINLEDLNNSTIAEYLRACASESSDKVGNKKSKDEYLLREAITDYYEDRVRFLAVQSQKTYKCVLYQLEKFMDKAWEENGQRKTVGNITQSHMLRFLLETCRNGSRSRDINANTFNKLLGVSSGFFSHLKKMGILEFSPTANIWRKQPVHPDTRALTISEKEKILRQALKNKNGLRDYVIILLALNGVKLSELAQLKIGNVDFVNGMVYIKSGISTRTLPLHNGVLSVLKKYINDVRLASSAIVDPSSPLFAHAKGRLTLASIERIVSNVLRICGLSGGGICLRKTYALNLLNSGINIVWIMHLLGHKNITTTVNFLNINKLETLEMLKTNFPKAFQLIEVPDPKS